MTSKHRSQMLSNLVLSLSLLSSSVPVMAVVVPNQDWSVLTAKQNQTSIPAPTEIVIIDAQVLDAAPLMESIGKNALVYRLNSYENGVVQITRILTRHQHLKAVHLLSHGQDGSLSLGSSQLSRQTLKQYQKNLSQWRQALAPDADILLYGCNVAASTVGKTFVTALSKLVGADVAASIDFTGNPSLRGNWNLEYQSGRIEPHEFSNRFARSNYSHLLATTTLNFNNTPTLVSGTALSLGAVYRFSSVSPGVDALVTVAQLSNATLINIDDNTNLPVAYPNRFQPVIRHNTGVNTTSFIRFDFALVLTGTSIPTSVPNIYFSPQDIDGAGTNIIREFVEVLNGKFYYLPTPTFLQPRATPSVPGAVGYEIINAANTQAGIGTDDRYEAYGYIGANPSTFSIIGGNINGTAACSGASCDRQNSWTFDAADVQKLDFSDAPASYGDAVHAVPLTVTVSLGILLDGDDGFFYSPNADADGIDDDGVTSFPSLTTSSTNYSVTTICRGNTAAVAGWIDFNRNGTFDSGERASATCNGTSATLNWTGLSGLVAGASYARFRISGTAAEVANPTGIATNGEVEDYALPIIALPSTLTADKTVVVVVDSDKSGGTIPLASQVPTPGDILEYAVIVKNTNPTTQRDNVILKDAIPANTAYVVGTLDINGVTKTDGTDTDQAEFASSQAVFRLGTGANGTTGGTLAANATSTIKFRVKVNDPLPGGVTTVSNQAVVSSSGVADVNSNDPATPALLDPTVTKIAPRLRLVKRVTGVKKFGSSTTTAVPSYNNLATDVNDDPTVGWIPTANAYLLGAITGNQIPASPGAPAPTDEVEYTIYFLLDGGIPAQTVSLCDFVPADQTYVPATLQLNLNGGTTTSIADTPNAAGGFYGTTPFPAACTGTNNGRGAASFQVGNLTSGSYGFIRFRAKVN